MVTGKVLRPTEEELQQPHDDAVIAMLKAWWDDLVKQCEDMPVRYDPPLRGKRQHPEAKHFWSQTGNGKSNSRTQHKRVVHKSWGRK